MDSSIRLGCAFIFTCGCDPAFASCCCLCATIVTGFGFCVVVVVVAVVVVLVVVVVVEVVVAVVLGAFLRYLFSPFLQDLGLGPRGSWTICRLLNDLNLDFPAEFRLINVLSFLKYSGDFVAFFRYLFSLSSIYEVVDLEVLL